MLYTQYVNDFWQYHPGEHHVVAVYLYPLLLRLTGLQPIYINPDGMKDDIHGDLVYSHQGRLIGIEVKIHHIQLTAKQMGNSYRPDYLIFFNADGIYWATWSTFKQPYLTILQDRINESDGQRTYERYGPSLQPADLPQLSRASDDESFHRALISWFPGLDTPERIG